MWDWIVNILFELLKLIQTFAVDWGLSIIILVVIIRLLLTPLMLKSTKSTARMQVLQPKMLEIQERYADDPQRQAEEMQKFYSENKFNPMAGCLPLLIQMPVLFALFTLLRNLPDYFNDGTFSFFNILPDLTTTPSASFADGFMVALPALVCLILFAVLTLIPQLYMSAQPDRPAGPEHAYDGRCHDGHDALDGLEPSRWCSAVLRRLVCLAGYPADFCDAEGHRQGEGR